MSRRRHTPADPPLGPLVPPIQAHDFERRELSGRDVTLLPPDPARDVPRLYAASHGSEEAEAIWTYVTYGPFHDEADMTRWLEDVADSTDPVFFTVMATDDRGPLGMVSFLNIDRGMRRMELGHIWYTPHAQRTTANTEAAYLMLREAFERYESRRVEWKCDALNLMSRQAAVRLGFTFEGVFRKHMIVKGRSRDTAWFAMTDEQWPARRRLLEEWLYEAPRTDAGRPSQSLTETMGTLS